MRTSIFDAHFHIVDPRFPLVRSDGFLPEPYTCAMYREAAAPLGIAGGAVVSGSLQAFDQGHLVDALQRLGAGYVGMTQLPPTATDAEIVRLHEAGVRAVRFNLKRGGSADVSHLQSVARRVHDVAGWHVELYVDSRELPALETTLARLPTVSIDHLGLSKDGLASLLRLVARGVKVKATGFGRVDFDVGDAIRAIHAVDPAALMFGTDLPSTRAPVPFRPSDIDLVVRVLRPESHRVLWKNARDFYTMTVR
ncbi:MAG TPA: amidohydrolase family protein [Casimicrobiaceae bacterium]|nr:amidohydrolase family protein [Casimicrobiaceae bacterium]